MVSNKNMSAKAEFVSLAVTSGLLPVSCGASNDIMFSNGIDAIFVSNKRFSKNEKIVSAISLCNAIKLGEKKIDSIVTFINQNQEETAYNMLNSAVVDFAREGTQERSELFAKHMEKVATDSYFASMFANAGLSQEEISAISAKLSDNANQTRNEFGIENGR